MLKQDKDTYPVILIVDDQPSNVIALEQAIRGLGKILFATSGHDALRIAGNTSPDLILLDIEMPGMNGYEICQKLRAMDHMSEASIIFITSHTETDIEIAALEMGGVDFIHKPLNIPLALARIRTHLDLQTKTKQLAISQKNLADIVFNLPLFIGQFDAELNGLFTNDFKGIWTRFSGTNFIGKSLKDLLGDKLYQEVMRLKASLKEGEKTAFDFTLEHSLHVTRYCEVSLVKQASRSGDHLLLLMNDITARKVAELSLSEEKERIRIMLESIADAVIATDTQGRVTYINAAAECMTGWPAAEAIGQEIETVMPLTAGSSDYPLSNPVRVCLDEQRTVGMAIDTALVRRDGQKLNVEDSASPVKNHSGEIIGAIIIFHDVSHARQMAVQMTQLANFDVLTGLPNRELLKQKAEQAINNTLTEKSHVALMLLDIDNFKSINNSIGHSAGDLILQKVSSRLKSKLSGQQILCRRGGDEFIFLLPDVSDIDHIRAFIDNVINIISEVYFIADKRLNLTASVGVSLFPDDASDLESLFRHADTAMYNAKKLGKNQYCFFSREIEDSVRSKHELEMRMYEALENNAFEVHYQPKYSVSQRKWVGAEALIRWRHDDGEFTPPSDFIPIAEESGLIMQIGEFVLKQACLDCKNWQSSLPGMHVAVNVSAIQFEQSDFVGYVRQTLQETQLPPTLLELEVTEGVLANDLAKMLNLLNELRAIGVSIAVDDFGTGYSSLTYLKYFPINVLKIDRVFIKDMLINHANHGIVEAIINMAGSLKLDLVAEGVETEDVAKELSSLGCDSMQGFFYAKPLNVNDMVQLATDHFPM